MMICNMPSLVSKFIKKDTKAAFYFIKEEPSIKIRHDDVVLDGEQTRARLFRQVAQGSRQGVQEAKVCCEGG